MSLSPLGISESGPSQNVDLVLTRADNYEEGALLCAVCHRPAFS